jgi:hypothetical protein
MDTAVVIRRVAISTRPQWALMIHSINGYCVCVVDKAFQIAEGQELSRHDTHRGVWVVSGSNVLFPANIPGGMTFSEAEASLSRITNQSF